LNSTKLMLCSVKLLNEMNCEATRETPH
jgi:hypothetical protein